MIITIDGPAGSGKSTAARQLARRLGITYLDTGATYRAVTLRAMRLGVDMADEAALARVAREARLELFPASTGLRVSLDGQDVTGEIRTPEVSEKSHYVARSGACRAVLVELQRKIGLALGDFVTEGRDQGSVVFPDADFKFYLDAKPEVRAQRRCAELQAAKQDADCRQVLAAIVQRDERDMGRSVGPLVKPAGSIVIDTTSNTIEETMLQLLKHVGGRR
jgi:cytidylate kinase